MEPDLPDPTGINAAARVTVRSVEPFFVSSMESGMHGQSACELLCAIWLFRFTVSSVFIFFSLLVLFVQRPIIVEIPKFQSLDAVAALLLDKGGYGREVSTIPLENRRDRRNSLLAINDESGGSGFSVSVVER